MIQVQTRPLLHLWAVEGDFEARRAEAPAGACREGGAMRRPGGTDRNVSGGRFPLEGGCRDSDRGVKTNPVGDQPTVIPVGA